MNVSKEDKVMDIISFYVICFLFYSFFGWFFEVSLYMIRDRKFVNRGFLNGPYCPIYGAGAMMILLLFGQMTNMLGLFLSSAVVCCTLEYITSYVMEKLFNARWWDYSDLPFNLNGRVCLLGAGAFGTLSVLMIVAIQPAVSGVIKLLSPTVQNITAVILGALFITDCITTFCAMAGFSKRLEAAAERLSRAADAAKDKLHVSGLHERRDHLLRHFNRQERRIIMAFPRMHMNRHDELLAEFREAVKNHRIQSKSGGDKA